MLNLPKNAKPGLIAERVPKIPMERESVGQVTTAHRILQSLFLLNQDSSLKVSETRNKSHVEQAPIRIYSAQSNASIALVEVSAPNNKWDGIRFARLVDTVSSYLRRSAPNVQQELIQTKSELITSTNAKIVSLSTIALSQVLTLCKRLFSVKKVSIVSSGQPLRSCSPQIVGQVTTQTSVQAALKISISVTRVSIVLLALQGPSTSRTTAFRTSIALEVLPQKSVWIQVNSSSQKCSRSKRMRLLNL